MKLFKKKTKYYLSFMGKEQEVTKEQYIAAERMYGFKSKFGVDNIATSSWSKDAVSGRVEYGD